MPPQPSERSKLGEQAGGGWATWAASQEISWCSAHKPNCSGFGPDGRELGLVTVEEQSPLPLMEGGCSCS